MKKICIFVLLSFFVAISISPYLQAEETETKNIKTDIEYWNNAMYYYADRSFQSSAEEFEGLSRNHPYSNLTHNTPVLCFNNKSRHLCLHLTQETAQ